MIPKSSKLRKALRSRALSGKTSNEHSKKEMSERHGTAFLLMGIAMALNLNTSLLTEKVFHCQNFSNKCVLAYMLFISVASFIAFFILDLNFVTMVIGGWVLVASQLVHVLVGMFGKGTMARNIFILCYGINGALEGLIAFSATSVIAKSFLDSTVSLMYAGFPAGKIILGVLQTILNRVIGTNTMSQMRTSLVLCHAFHVLLSLPGCIWITLLCFKCGLGNDGGSGDCKKIERIISSDITKQFGKAVENFGYARLYSSRLTLTFLRYFLRYFFFPCLIPFLMEVTYTTKLASSLIFTIAEFIGKIEAVNINESIDPSGRSPSQSHSIFIWLRDTYLHLLILSALASSSLLIWSSLNVNYTIPQSSIFVFCFSIVMGLVYGYIATRSVNGCKPVLQYYNKNVGGGKVDEKTANGSGHSDVIILVTNTVVLPISILSNTAEQIILRHKSSRSYILRNSKGNLSKEAVDALLMQFNKVI